MRSAAGSTTSASCSPNGPKKWDEAEAARTRLLNEINERRRPRTIATVQQLLDYHLPLMHAAETTRRNYERYVRYGVTFFHALIQLAEGQPWLPVT